MDFIYNRRETVNNYPRQLEFIEAPERYTIVEATTKAGKTTGCLIWLFEQARKGKAGQNYWWVAPTKSMALDTWYRMRRNITNRKGFTCLKGELTITLYNGAVISFKSAFEPEYLYGRDVMAVVMDEATRIREEAWFAICTLITKTAGKVKIIGNVKGANNWVYRFAREAEAGKLKDWRYFKITATHAIEAGILTQEAVDAAQSVLPNDVFLELYYGIPNQKSSNKFCYAFEKEKHVGKCNVNYNYPVYVSFDFNHNPICCSIIQVYNNTLWVPHCIKLPTSNIFELCKTIRKKFPNAKFYVTGDASGNSQSAWAEDANTYYTIIQKWLMVENHRMYVPAFNPRQHKNQVLVNAVLEKFKVQIDPDNAMGLIMDFSFVEVNPDGTIKKKNRYDEPQQADLLDTFRYFCNSCMDDYFPISRYV